MKKIAIALTALAGITFLSGCAYDYYGYSYYPYHRYALGYGYGPYHHYYWRAGLRYDCVYSFDATFCG